MSRQYRFHRDHGGHSVTVTVRLGFVREVELLVDGKETGYEREPHHRADVRLLSSQLPDDPPVPFSVRVELPSAGRGAPTCTMESGVHSHPMAVLTAP